jgi:YD repeat-containing protein
LQQQVREHVADYRARLRETGLTLAQCGSLLHLSRQTQVTDALNHQTTLTDPVGNTTTFAFDALGRETQETDPLNHSATFAYDAAGRMTSTTDQLTRRQDFAFDADNRKTLATWYDVGGTMVLNRQTFTYDQVGNQLTAADANGAYTMGYDALNRLTSEQEPFGQVLTYAYDGVGNRTLVQDSQNGVMTSVYDAANELTTRELSGSGVTPLRIDFTYTPTGLTATEKRYSDLAGTTKVGETDYSYDAASRVTSITHLNGSATTLASFAYTYDLADRLSTETDNGGTPVTYSYDNTNQVTGDGTNNYTYDANGNRTMADYSTGPGNQLLSDGIWNYSYDAEGNLIEKQRISTGEAWLYGYDNQNHLIWAEDHAAISLPYYVREDFKYDVQDNLIERDVTQGGVTTVSHYAYEGTTAWVDLDGSNNLVTRRVFDDTAVAGRGAFPARTSPSGG